MASIPSDAQSLHTLTLAAQTMSDKDLIEFCEENDSTADFCQQSYSISQRLENSRIAASTGRSPSTAASIRSLLSTGSTSVLEEQLDSLDDLGFVEAVAVNDKAVRTVLGNELLSIRLSKLDPELASEIGVQLTPVSDANAVLGLGPSQPRSRRTPPVASPARASPPRSSSPTRSAVASSRASPSVRSSAVERTADGDLILSGTNIVADARVLSQVSQDELADYAEDEYVLGVLASPAYQSIKRSQRAGSGGAIASPRSSSPRASSPSPVRSASNRTAPASRRSPSNVIGGFNESADEREYGSARSRSPSRRSFAASGLATTPVATVHRRSLSPSRRTLGGRSAGTGSILALPLTYNRSQDIRTLASYSKADVEDRAASDAYVASLVRSPEYKQLVSGNGDILTGTCTVSCRRS